MNQIKDRPRKRIQDPDGKWWSLGEIVKTYQLNPGTVDYRANRYLIGKATWEQVIAPPNRKFIRREGKGSLKKEREENNIFFAEIDYENPGDGTWSKERELRENLERVLMME